MLEALATLMRAAVVEPMQLETLEADHEEATAETALIGKVLGQRTPVAEAVPLYTILAIQEAAELVAAEMELTWIIRAAQMSMPTPAGVEAGLVNFSSLVKLAAKADQASLSFVTRTHRIYSWLILRK